MDDRPVPTDEELRAKLKDLGGKAVAELKRRGFTDEQIEDARRSGKDLDA